MGDGEKVMGGGGQDGHSAYRIYEIAEKGKCIQFTSVKMKDQTKEP